MNAMDPIGSEARLKAIGAAKRWDRSLRRNEALEDTRAHARSLQEAIVELVAAERNEERCLTLGLCLKLLGEQARSNFPVLGGLRLDEKTIREIDRLKNQVEAGYAQCVCKRAEDLAVYALSDNPSLFYLDRQRLLDRSLRLAQELLRTHQWPQNISPTRQELYGLLARLYLIRSRMILPRGDGFPPKKIEALSKAFECAKKVNGSLPHSFESLYLYARIGVESARHTETPLINRKELLDYLQKLFEQGFHPQKHGQEYFGWEIIDYANRLHIAQAKAFLPSLLARDPGDIPQPVHHRIYLLQARAAKALSRSSEMKQKLRDAMEILPDLHFGDLLWDEVADFLDELRKSGFAGWEDLAVECWEKCQVGEQRPEFKLSVGLRWYWTRFHELYETAFLAALKRDHAKAIQIADSTKSRPTIKQRALEESLKPNDEDHKILRERIYSLEANDQARQFTTNLRDIRKEVKAIRPASSTFREPILPQGWAAAHIFIGKEGGHVLVSSINGVMHKLISPDALNRLWQRFHDWQRGYRDIFRGNRNVSLVKAIKRVGEPRLQDLCSTLGDTFDFLFELKESGVLFVPHGFLHLLPLHAARDQAGRFLFEEKRTSYLPAASFAEGLRPPGNTSGDALFVSWEGNQFDSLYEDWPGHKLKDATPRAVLDYLEKSPNPPRLLALLCHGATNPINPFLSCLLLNRKRLTHLELRRTNFKLNGTSVVLGACESDMVSESSSPMDDPLSLATAFLLKGVSSVTGNLWKVEANLQQQVVDALRKESPCHCLWKLQNLWLTEQRLLFYLAPFRVIGAPFAA